MALWVELLTESSYWRRAGLSALVSVGWMAPATVWMVDLTPVGWPLAVLGFAAMHAVAGALVPPDGRRHAAFPAAFALAELLRWTWPFGGVPLATMAMAQVSGPLASTARIGGPLLLTALTAVGGVTLAAILAARIRPAAVGVGVLLVALPAAIVAPGSEPIDVDGTPDDDALITVAAVQGGGPQNTRADVCEQRAVFERHLNTTLQQVSAPVDLVVWPEDVVHPSPDAAITPARCDQPLLTDSEARAALSDLARGLDAVLIVGFFERTADLGANRNYAAAYDSSGVPVDTYDKVQLVPFGEYVPLRATAERFSDELPARDVRVGASDEPAVLDTPLGPLGVAISWEIFFDHRARSAVGGGEGRVLLNPTNGSSYWLTVVQTQQIASSRLRAIETDRWVVQAAPTGFSAVITPEGDVIERTGISESRVIQTTLELRHGDTLAVRLGTWPVAVAAALTLSLALGLGRVLTRSLRPGRKL
ncbi:MAG: apolipoprotein N-acyltransferase [Acidimicrobiaceae bacterium]|nr:apolipoprotein N-acyltransferase [Acidimicrobiaceae bacterium]